MSHGRSNSWTPERIECVMALWKAGKSGSQIGAALGITRNAAIGKLHRLGMSKHDGIHRAGRYPSTRKPAEKKPKPFKLNGTPLGERPAPRLDLVWKTESATEAPKSRRLSILTVTKDTCKYTPDTDVPFRFCGRKVHPGSSWCPYHFRLCINQVSSSEAKRRADRDTRAVA